MNPGESATGFARLTPWQARAVVALFLLTCVFFVGVTVSPLRKGNVGRHRPGESDVALYRAEVERIHAGESYYQAAAAELSARGYPTRSVFNWRTPLPMWLLGRLPDARLGQALLAALALGLLLVSFEALAREAKRGIWPAAMNLQHLAAEKTSPKRQRGTQDSEKLAIFPSLARRARVADSSHKLNLSPVLGPLLLTGPLMFCVLADLFVMPVLWAGVLIALSIVSYGVDRPRQGVAFALAAVFFRDLALPYCLLAAGMAWWSKRRGELLAWGVGLAAWLAFFAWHWTQAAALTPPGARAHAQSWIQFGGAGFVIATAQMNAYLLLLPQGVTALYLAAAMLGFAGWNTSLGVRCGLAACLFLAAFAVVGQEFNQYWGCLTAPLLCFGAARFPASLRDLCASALRGVAGQRAALRPRY